MQEMMKQDPFNGCQPPTVTDHTCRYALFQLPLCGAGDDGEAGRGADPVRALHLLQVGVPGS